MKTILIIAFAGLLLLLIAGPARGEIPYQINYQGLLMDDQGHPLNGSHSLHFQIKDVEGNQLWSETHPAGTVPLEDGVFSVILGAYLPLTPAIIEGHDLMLVITVDDDEPLPPQPLTATPFAVRAAVADSLATGAGGADADWIIDGDDMHAGPSGNVGIGTTNPRRRLEILGDGEGGGIRWGTTYGGSLLGDIYHGGTGNGFIINSNAGGGTWADLHLQTNAVTRLYVDSSGKVGIGTITPAQMLDVNGTVEMTGFKLPVSPGIGWVLTSDAAGVGTWQPAGGSTGDGDWIISGSDMYSSVSGNVGVGTSDPAAALHVEGDGRVLMGRANGSRPAIDGKHNGSGNYGYVGASGCGLYGYGENLPGVHAASDSVAVYGENTSTQRTLGYLGGRYGVYGRYGSEDSGKYAYLGGPSFALYAEDLSSGNYGFMGYWNYGVLGHSDSQAGVKGRAVGGTGVVGEANTGWAVYGTQYSTGNTAYLAGPYAAVFGESTNNGPAVHGRCIDGQAGFFQGNVDIVGDLDVSSGRLTTPVIEITGGSDLSERFDIVPAGFEPSPRAGFLVCLDPEHPGRLKVSSEPYDKKVAGVISGAGGIQPGMVMRQDDTEACGDWPVALTGRVYCWADASAGAIEPGDLLTTSATPGHAMKAVDSGRTHGTVIGKAMSRLDSGQGLVLVLVNLQ